MNHATWRNTHALCFAKRQCWTFPYSRYLFWVGARGTCQVLWPEWRHYVLCQQEGVVRIRSELRRHDHWSHYGQFPRLWTICITHTEASGPRPRDLRSAQVCDSIHDVTSHRSYNVTPHLAKCHLSGHLGSHHPLPWVSSVPGTQMHSIRDYLPPGILKFISMRSRKSRGMLVWRTGDTGHFINCFTILMSSS